MPNIRYVCLSDLHLGEEDSLLTAIDGEGRVDACGRSPVLELLAACLGEALGWNASTAPEPALILNGDLLELALAPTHEVLGVFEQFLRALLPGSGALFGQVVFLPGNHDHHLWQAASEAQYLNYLERHSGDVQLEKPWSATKLFMDMNGKDRLASGLLTGIARRLPHLRAGGFEVLTAYPNYGLEGDGRAVVFHHGHFMEPVYHLMSTAASLVFPDQTIPTGIHELEQENGAWIDFLWSMLGSSGKICERAETLYEATLDEATLRCFARRLACNIARKYDVPYLWPDCVEELALRFVFGRVARRATRRQERRDTSASTSGLPLSAAALDGLRWYVEGPLACQIRAERGRMPESLSLVIGHTHKPFEASMAFEGWRASVLNTGGWVVDSVQREPQLGASVVLVDEDLNAASLRIYNEGSSGGVRIAAEPGNPLADYGRERLERGGACWSALGEAVHREIALRASHLARRIERMRD